LNAYTIVEHDFKRRAKPGPPAELQANLDPSTPIDPNEYGKKFEICALGNFEHAYAIFCERTEFLS